MSQGLTTLTINLLRRDGGTQPRAGLRTDVVDGYAEALADGATFPPVIVFYDGTDHWLADGFHRAMAFEQAGRTEIPADIRQGTRRDAVLFSTGANATHGLPRTREDKWRAVETLLLDEEWGKWADREIGRKTGTHGTFVAKVRSALTAVNSSERTFTTKHGTVAIMNTAAIGVAPEEVERRIAEAKAKAERETAETARKLAELEAISKAGKEAASRREANLIEARDKVTQSLAKTQGDLAEALADKRRALADKQAAEERAAKEAERAAEEAWQEADEKYETRINQLAREASESKHLAEQRARELSAAVAQAQADAKKAADDMAEALVAQKLETRKKELAEIEDKYQRAKKNAEHAANAKERLEQDLKLTKDMIQKHEAEMERWASGEAEIATQVKIAADLSEALGRAMTELLMLEHGPQTAAAQKLQKAAQMSRQMAEALETFLSPRLSASASTVVSNEHHQRH